MQIEVLFNYAKTTEFGQIRFLDSFEKRRKPLFFSPLFFAFRKEKKRPRSL